jgi:predicted acylesterase/phospholipase RssA
MPLYTSLVVGGGGIKGVSVLGCLSCMHDNNLINSITRYYGTSVGSIICVMLVAGYTPLECFETASSMDVVVGMHTDPNKIVETYGLADMSTLGDRLKEVLIAKIGFVPTFKQFYEVTGKYLGIVGTNVTKSCQVVFNHTTHGDMSVVEAVEISCNLPLVFGEKFYDGCEWMDGGFVNDYPIDVAEAETGGGSVIGVCVDKTTVCDIPPDETTTIDANKQKGFLGRFMDSVVNKLLTKTAISINIPIGELHKLRMRYSRKDSLTFTLKTNETFTKFAADSNKKEAMFKDGYNMVAEELEKIYQKVAGSDEEWVDF